MPVAPWTLRGIGVIMNTYVLEAVHFLRRITKMARKMKTMDGNHAAAHASYALRMSRLSTRLPRHLPWQKLPMSGRPRGERTFSDTKCRSLRCSPRQALQALYTVSFRRRSDHHLHGFSGSSADDPEPVQDRRRAAAGCVQRIRPCSGKPRSVHFR